MQGQISGVKCKYPRQIYHWISKYRPGHTHSGRNMIDNTLLAKVKWTLYYFQLLCFANYTAHLICGVFSHLLLHVRLCDLRKPRAPVWHSSGPPPGCTSLCQNTPTHWTRSCKWTRKSTIMVSLSAESMTMTTVIGLWYWRPTPTLPYEIWKLEMWHRCSC